MSNPNNKQTDYFLEVSGEITEGKGEDYFLSVFSQEGCALAVFDGCGGIGSQQYGELFDNHTGAYIASRTVGNAFSKWFKNVSSQELELSFENLPRICDEVHRVFEDEINRMGNRVVSDSNLNSIKGSMYKVLPTTASIVMCQYDADQLELCYLWAGDSRGYLLNDRGIMQITKDDTNRNLDAWESLFNDQSLSNLIVAFDAFDLNACHISSELPVLAIVATDGCFDYLPTPMHFEYLILSSLMVSNDFEEWESKMKQQLHEISGDDYAMEIGSFGFQDFDHLKDYFRKRADLINYTCQMINTYSESKTKEIWEKYKEAYYRDQA